MDRKMTECKECGGEGFVFWDVADARYEHTTREATCPECDGSGEVEAEEEEGDDIIDRCYFCDAEWGSCRCPEVGISEGLDTGDMIITRPNLSPCSRFFVDPTKAYGMFEKWLETPPAAEHREMLRKRGKLPRGA